MTPSARRQTLILVGLGLLAFGWLWWTSLSPLRGRWVGEFDGSVAGTATFHIGVRGTEVEGRMEGTVEGGEPFTAEITGRMVGSNLDASFLGSTRGGPLGIQFRGTMVGALEETGAGQGTWRCELERAGQVLGSPLQGRWLVEREAD